MFHFQRSSKVAPEPPTSGQPPTTAKVAPPIPPTPILEMNIIQSSDPIWKDFSIEIEANNNNNYTIDYSEPGPLAEELAELCSRKGAIELDSQKIMYFSEVANYLLILKKDKQPIGFLLLFCYPGGSEAKIWLICVISSEKGKQYSKILIDRAKKIAKKAGKSSLHLEAISREVGRKVYEPQGFTFNSSKGDDMSIYFGGSRKSKTRKQRKSRRRS